MKKNILKLILSIACAFPILAGCTPKTPQNVVITVDNSKTTVYQEDVAAFDPTEIFTITVDGQVIQTKAEYIITNMVEAKGGTYAIVASYGDKTMPAVVTVIGTESVEIGLSALSYTVYSSEVSKVDFRKMFTVKVKGEVIDVTDEMWTSNVTANPGVYECKVSFNGQTKTMKVTVLEDILVPVSVTAATNGNKVSATRSLTLDYQVFNSLHDSSVTVTFEGAGKEYVKYTPSTKTISLVDGCTLKGQTTVTVIIASKEDPTAKAQIKLIVAGEAIEGQVGNLTAAMIEEIANPSITVTGVISDVYHVIASGNEIINKYDMTVEMEEGKWMGKWNAQENPEIVTSDYYKRSDELVKSYKTSTEYVTGYGLEQLYVGIDNKPFAKAIKDYMSRPTLWEDQHLWNHLGEFDIAKFEQDTNDMEHDAYKYIPDYKTSTDGEYADDAWLLTYLPYSMTPMMSDTLDTVKFYVKDGHISGLYASTEVLYDDEDKESATEFSYTTVELTFSKVGTTKVSDPEPYAAPSHVEKLQNAFNNMKTVTNFSFNAVETEQSAPVSSGDDYELSANAGNVSQSVKARRNAFGKTTTATGTVGTVGQVTADAIVFAKTGKYSAALEGDNLYYTDWYGYKQVEADAYDYFAYGKRSDGSYGLHGTKKINGKISSMLPQWNVSPNLFDFKGTDEQGGKTYYKFTLKDGNVANAVAKQMLLPDLCKDAAGSTRTQFTVVVDDAGNVARIVMPYSMVSGMYTGYYTITFSNFGTTTIGAEVFEGYEPRVLKYDWKDYICKYYTETFSTRDTHEADMSVVLDAVYGDEASNLPPPAVFFNIVGDNINGPFYDWKAVGTDPSTGEEINHGYVSINVKIQEVDENNMTTAETRDRIYDELVTEMSKYGFVIDKANTDFEKGYGGSGSKNITFINGNITVRIEMYNANAFLYIEFYQTGDWTLKR